MLTVPPSSHINAETPGSIHEGGELGYALAVSFGAVMDNPDLIVPCIIGDGEAESGPTATYVPQHLSEKCDSDRKQFMACNQVHRSQGVWCSSSDPPP